MEANGNCFSTAAKLVLFGELPDENAAILASEINDFDVRIAHGMVTRRTDGLRHVHAWVELDTGLEDQFIVLDFSNGNSAILDRNAYYAAGRIEASEVKRYTPHEASIEMVNTGVWGPWDETFTGET